MKNSKIDADEVILFEDDITNSDLNEFHLILTSQKIIFEQKKGIIKQKNKIVDIIKLNEIKVYQDKIQVHQKGTTVNIQTIKNNINLSFCNILKANKFVTKIVDAISGTTITERGINKIKGAINTIDDILEIDTRGTIKGVVENGIVGTILNGTSTKNVFKKKLKNTKK